MIVERLGTISQKIVDDFLRVEKIKNLLVLLLELKTCKIYEKDVEVVSHA